MAAVLAVCCVCCGPYRLLCGGGVPCGGKHIIIIISLTTAAKSRISKEATQAGKEGGFLRLAERGALAERGRGRTACIEIN